MIAWAIEALVASTALMLFVLLVRRPVREAFGPGVAYALWLLPAGRLLLPPLPGAWIWGRLFGPAIEATSSGGIAMGVLNADKLPPSIADQALVTAAIEQGGQVARLAVVPPAAAADGPSLALLALAFWVGGALVFIGYHLIRHSAFCQRLIRGAARVRPLPPSGIRLIETDAATGPLAFGIWRKYVVFPTDFEARYDEQERDLALAHELTHHARGDLIANWAALLVLAIHWFNPIAWRAFRAFRADQEMACDARVLAGRDPAFRHAYGRAIVKSAHGRAVSAACHLHTINELKGRLKMLSVGRKSRLRVASGAASVAVLALAGLGLTASGTQAAERLRTNVSRTIGVDIASLDAAVAVAPSAPAAPGKVTPPPAPPAPETLAIPPSVAAPDAPEPPALPQAALPPVPPTAAVAPPPPLPPVADTPGERVERRVEVVTTDAPNADGKIRKRIRIIRRDKDGKLISEDVRGMHDIEVTMPEIPEVTSANCPSDGNPHETVLNREKDGKRIMIICTNRIEKLAARAGEMSERAAGWAARSKDIERHAYESALQGLRSARAKASNPEAIKGLDEAIADIEKDIAELN